MSIQTRRFMRLIVFFDLPVTTPEKKRAYIEFRRFLLKDGFVMLQWSVYTRITNNYDDTKKHMRRLERNAPPEGSVRCLEVTEKQFTSMAILVGQMSQQEKYVNSNQMTLL
ncbi:MAG: CRISPR-associated protein Cas2 [Marinobacter sp. T13-3]|nr:MAG: CRISPR-associated protein Cas2 [Marinobacter sp. T13-3]